MLNAFSAPIIKFLVSIKMEIFVMMISWLSNGEVICTETMAVIMAYLACHEVEYSWRKLLGYLSYGVTPSYGARCHSTHSCTDVY